VRQAKEQEEQLKEQERLKKETNEAVPGTYEAKVIEIKEKHKLMDDLPEITEHNSVSEVQSQLRSNSSESRKLKASIISNKSIQSYH